MMTLNDVTIVLPTKGRKGIAAKALQHIRHRPLLLVLNAERLVLDRPTPSVRAWQHTALILANCTGQADATARGIEAVETQLACYLTDDIDWNKASSKFEVRSPNFPNEDGWLIEALRVYNEAFGGGTGPARETCAGAPGPAALPRETGGVVALNDGRDAPASAAFGLISVAWFKRRILPNTYERFYLDTEIARKAKDDGAFAYAENARLPHLFLPGAVDNGRDYHECIRRCGP